MLHATIRKGRGTFHFFGEVDGYSLQTLREHVQQTRRGKGAVRLLLEIDDDDKTAFAKCTGGWLPEVVHSGVAVDVQVRHFRPHRS
jgi:hypothetical protein